MVVCVTSNFLVYFVPNCFDSSISLHDTIILYWSCKFLPWRSLYDVLHAVSFQVSILFSKDVYCCLECLIEWFCQAEVDRSTVFHVHYFLMIFLFIPTHTIGESFK